MNPNGPSPDPLHTAQRPLRWIIVGGGLAGGTLALAIAARGGGTGLTLLERADRLGGNKTWSFHQDDVSGPARDWLDPLVGARWPGYLVRFPDGERRVPLGYASITSERFDQFVQLRLAQAGARVRLGAEVVAVGLDEVRLAGGEVLRADVVVDARGLATHDLGAAPRSCGYQKFVGLDLELGADVAPAEPVLMDATVPQADGYRFMYVLPFGPRRVLVEDTCFSNDPELDGAAMKARVLDYVARSGWPVTKIVREETGVLPMPWQPPALGPGTGVVVGYGGGWFHPATGYSLPLAVRMADALSVARSSQEVMATIRTQQRRYAPQMQFCRMLNRLLFTAIDAPQRWGLFARFYRLPTATIQRFYALETSRSDRLRLICGRPPRGLSVRAALFPEVNA